MIDSKTETFYSVWVNLPKCKHLPHGTNIYDALNEYHSLDRLETLICTEINNLKYSLHKYSRGYDANDHKEMCSEMSQLLEYLNKCLTEIVK